METIKYVKLSKEISYALRHNPSQYKLELDEEGFVSVDQLLCSLNNTKHYPKEIIYADILKVIELSDKKRLELLENKIRALYGHSVLKQIKKAPLSPPDILYHGTSHRALEFILKEGLKPMKRQYVHLSVDQETARCVGGRRDSNPILLQIDTKQAIQSGIQFYKGNDMIWLSDFIPTACIQIV